MDLAIHVYDYTVPGGPRRLASTLVDIARAAEDSGAATLTLIDHRM